jgi:hypothetical protein
MNAAQTQKAVRNAVTEIYGSTIGDKVRGNICMRVVAQIEHVAAGNPLQHNTQFRGGHRVADIAAKAGFTL